MVPEGFRMVPEGFRMVPEGFRMTSRGIPDDSQRPTQTVAGPTGLPAGVVRSTTHDPARLHPL